MSDPLQPQRRQDGTSGRHSRCSLSGKSPLDICDMSTATLEVALYEKRNVRRDGVGTTPTELKMPDIKPINTFPMPGNKLSTTKVSSAQTIPPDIKPINTLKMPSITIDTTNIHSTTKSSLLNSSLVSPTSAHRATTLKNSTDARSTSSSTVTKGTPANSTLPGVVPIPITTGKTTEEHPTSTHHTSEKSTGSVTGTIISHPSALTASSTVSSRSSTTAPPVMLTLPPAAAFVPLTDYTATTPAYITTTSPGGNSPTVVPIIIPFIGPPQICFNCFNIFPPNIQIDTPKFCVQLFKLRNGNCPLDEIQTNKNEKNDNDDNKDDKDKDKDKDDKEDSKDNKKDDKKGEVKSIQTDMPTATSKPTVTEKPTSTKDSTKESCDTTSTAFHKSITCIKTATNQASLSCSTKTYSTVTGCRATGSSTTVTGSYETLDAVPCSPETCGGGKCPVPALALRPRKNKPRRTDKYSIFKRNANDQGDWVEPSQYPSHTEFIAGEVKAAHFSTSPRYQVVKWPDETDFPTSVTVVFGDEPVTLALEKLFGCTGVIVVSTRGVWMMHIWEYLFTKTTDAEFKEKVLDRLSNGLPKDFNADEYHKYNLLDLVENQNLPEELGFMFGEEGEVPDTRIFLFAPWKRLGDKKFVDVQTKDIKYYADKDNIPIPEEELYSENANQGNFNADDKLDKLSDRLEYLLGVEDEMRDPITDFVGYAPRTLPISVINRKPPISQDEAREFLDDRNYKSHRGKVLLQYQPAKCDGRKASWRLWIEGRELGERHFSWDAPMKQTWKPRQGRRAEEGEACPAKISQTASKATTSSQTSKTTTASNTSKVITTSHSSKPTLASDTSKATTTSHSSKTTIASHSSADSKTAKTSATSTTSKKTGESPAATSTADPTGVHAAPCDQEQCSKKACPNGGHASCLVLNRLPNGGGFQKICSCPQPEYTKGSCKASIWEQSAGPLDGVTAKVTLFDGGGHNLTYQETDGREAWNKAMSFIPQKTKLPKNLDIVFTNTLPKGVKAEPCQMGDLDCSPSRYKDWIIKLTYDGIAWDSTETDTKKPRYCTSNGWVKQNSLPFRNVDCHFPC